MPVGDSDKSFFKSVLSDDQILDSSSSNFGKHSSPWSLAYDKKPSLVLVPSSIKQVQSLVKYLYDSNLDFAIRTTGVGSSSASDVILSLKSFDQVVFDQKTETVEVGAGSTTGHAQGSLAKQAPDYALVCPRCPYVGLSGAVLHGGLSWLSHEFGLSVDPVNMIDAQVVLGDGRVLWASEEPELLWGLRGGGGSFGVVTAIRMKAHKYTRKIYGGFLMFPLSSLRALSTAVAKWIREVDDPKMALHVMVSPYRGESFHGQPKEPTLLCQPYDGHGEAHARSEAGFKWLLDIDGVQDLTSEMPYDAILELQGPSEAGHGTAKSWLQGALVQEVDDNMVVRGYEWYVSIQKNYPELQQGTIFLLEVMMKRAMTTASSTTETAWPHGAKGRQHVIQLSTGSTLTEQADLKTIQQSAMKVLKEAPSILSGQTNFPASDYLPNFVLPHLDIKEMFKGNWDRLLEVKRKYDAQGRFNKGPVAEFLTPYVL